jgi:hypothetical protein
LAVGPLSWVASSDQSKEINKMTTRKLGRLEVTGLPPWLESRCPLYLTTAHPATQDEHAVLLDKTVDGETFMQLRIVRGTRRLTNALVQAAVAFGLPRGTSGVFRALLSRYPQLLTVLFALIMLPFATVTLEAQLLAQTQLQEFNTAVQPATRFESYRKPVIPMVGRSGSISHEEPHGVTIETVVALGVYVVFGGIILALAASFRLLGDKVASFFALLIPEPVSRSLRERGRSRLDFALERAVAEDLVQSS